MKLKITGILLAVLSLCASEVFAARVTRDEALKAARAFAARGKVLGMNLGSGVESADALIGSGDDVVFYAVKMTGGGTLVTSGDTEFEPIIAILPQGEDINSLDKGHPLWELLNRDADLRREALTKAWESEKNRAKWNKLFRFDSQPRPKFATAIGATSEIADLRVAPLVKAQWSQSGNGENYSTPENYVCGCVATAMSQIMHYFKWPKAEIEPFVGNCSVDGENREMTAIGGLYDWANMPDAGGRTDAQKQAIGHLTYDCGVSVNMMWAPGGSGAYTESVAAALTDKFGYASAKKVSANPRTLPTTDEYLGKKVYACLDAGSPVELGINNETHTAGHAIVGDGYGFVDETSYVHLNMGWGGSGNAWYHLPEIEYKSTAGGTIYEASIVHTIIYNIFPEATGFVLSGRTLDEDGLPIANAQVTIVSEDSTTYETTTSANGVWAMIVPSGFAYEVSAVSETGDLFGELSDTVRIDDDNNWGNDIELANPSVRITRGGEELNFSTLHRALTLAQDDDVIEIFAPTKFKRSVTIGADNCTVTTTSGMEAINVVTIIDEAKINLPTGKRFALRKVNFVDYGEPLVSVETNATLVIEGVDIGGVTLGDMNGLELSGAQEKSIYVHTPSNNVGEVFATYSCDFATAKASAMYLLNPDDDELGGVASSAGTIVWGNAPVPEDVATVRMIAGGKSINYRSLKALMNNLPVTGDITIELIKDQTLASSIVAKGRKVTFTCEGAPATLSVTRGVKFTCGEGGEIVLDNVTVAGVTNYMKGSSELFLVDGGKLTLKAGATIRDHYTASECDAGAILLTSGEVVVEKGALISNCHATGGHGCGGAVRVNGGTLAIKGGEISGCSAIKFGQSVFVADDSNAAVTFEGAPVIENIFVDSSETDKLKVVGALEEGAKIGVEYGGSDSAGNKLGNVFATVEATLGAADVVANAFSNAKNPTLGGVLDEAEHVLVWGPGVPPVSGEGSIRVITGNVTNLYATIDKAFAAIKGDSRVEIMARSIAWCNDITVKHNVVLTTAPELIAEHGPDGVAVIWRGYNEKDLFNTPYREQIIVEADATLTLKNVILDGDFANWEEDGVITGDPRGMIYVKEYGTLILGEDALIINHFGYAGQDSAAISVNGGTVTMLDGSGIIGAQNYCINANADKDGYAGAIYAWKATVNLKGGAIWGCMSTYAGAVCLCGGSKGYLSESMEVGSDDYWQKNLTLSDDESDIVLDYTSTLSLAEPLDSLARVGRAYVASSPLKSDVNYVAQIDDINTWTNEVGTIAQLLASLDAFYHDANPSATAALVTNATEKALIVWNTALEGGIYKDKNGNVYAEYENPSRPIPLPIEFTEISIDEEEMRVTLTFEKAVKGCTYTILGSPTLKAEDFKSVSEFVHGDKDSIITIDLPIAGDRFWKATAK